MRSGFTTARFPRRRYFPFTIPVLPAPSLEASAAPQARPAPPASSPALTVRDAAQEEYANPKKAAPAAQLPGAPARYSRRTAHSHSSMMRSTLPWMATPWLRSQQHQGLPIMILQYLLASTHPATLTP